MKNTPISLSSSPVCSRAISLASLDASLKRLGLDYVDIFYHHRPDPNTPLEETMVALDHAVKSGKALYVGLSNYDGETMEKAAAILEELHCPFIINQNKYSIFVFLDNPKYCAWMAQSTHLLKYF